MDVNNYNNQNDYNYVCHVCGTDYDARQGVCPNCNTPANVVIPQTEVSQLQEAKSGKKTAVIVVSVVLAVLVAVGCALQIVVMNKDEYSKNTAAGKNNPKKLTEAELINACDLIDYSVYAEVFDAFIPTEYKGSMQSLIIDADKDGRQEMFVDVPVTDNPNNGFFFKTGTFSFDIASPENFSYDYTAKSDNYELYTNDNGEIYHIYSDGRRGYSEHIYKWGNSGFVEIGYYSVFAEKQPEQDYGYEDVFYGSELNGKTFSTLDEFNAEKEKLGLKRISGSNSQYLSNYFYTSKPEDVVNAYKNRVSNLNNNSGFVSGDYDNDGEEEYLFIIYINMEYWLDDLYRILMGDENFYYDFDTDYSYQREVYVYADADDKGVVFHALAIGNGTCKVDNVGDVSWENGRLGISIQNNTSAPDYFECFCDSAENTRKSLEDYEAVYRETAEKYISYIVNAWQGGGADPKPGVTMKYADIADYPGKECILVVKGAYESYIEVCTFYCGRVVVLYRIYENDGSVFLVNVDGKEHLLYYSQSRFDGGGGGSTYCYKALRFDQNCQPVYRDYYEITIYDNGTPDESHNAFFKGFNALLSSAKVCLDNYELTGYKYMQDSDISVSGDEQAKYLTISNCNRTKAGTVNIQDIESWLNFREGPSTQYNKILLDPADSKSFVKQAKGSAVTVIDTVNTGDEKNPIWVKIQIKYADRTLEGYSSQNYIDIPYIKHISVGESFTVTANTNDSGLNWSCNDTSVLSIDSSTGTVTGVKRGLVLVTVRSDSGLYDSCLVMVD